MTEIKREGTTLPIDCLPWREEYPYAPKTSVTLGYDEEGLTLHFTTDETNLRATETEHNTFVYKDSCMEAFIQFDPAHDSHYINIEINPNGAAFAACGTCREDYGMVAVEDIETLGVRTAVHEDGWEIFYRIPVAFVKKYIPSYRHGEGARLRANFYKCGDETDHPHFASFAPIGVAEPDFHRPEYFAELVLS